jgi:hypothetical protein
MTEPQNITRQDADRIADALERRTPQGRAESANRAISKMISAGVRGREKARADRTAKAFGWDKDGETSPAAKALAEVQEERRAYEAKRDEHIAERDLARAEREAATS